MTTRGIEEPRIPTLVCEACGEDILTWPGETMERARSQAPRAFIGHVQVCRNEGVGGYRLVEKEREHRR